MIIFFRIPSESPNMRKISLMLEETALPYVVKFVEPRKGGVLDTEFAKISPNGTTPAIVDTDTGATLFESGAILYFLAEKSGKLLPSNLGVRADVIKWLMFEAANVCPTMIELHHYVMNDTGTIPDAIFQRYKNRLAQYCSILDKQLEDREYLAGQYSIADIALYPWMVTLEDMAEINLDDYANMNGWTQAISKRSTTQNISQENSQKTNWCYRNGNVELCGKGGAQ